MDSQLNTGFLFMLTDRLVRDKQRGRELLGLIGLSNVDGFWSSEVLSFSHMLWVTLAGNN